MIPDGETYQEGNTQQAHGLSDAGIVRLDVWGQKILLFKQAFFTGFEGGRQAFFHRASCFSERWVQGQRGAEVNHAGCIKGGDVFFGRPAFANVMIRVCRILRAK